VTVDCVRRRRRRWKRIALDNDVKRMSGFIGGGSRAVMAVRRDATPFVLLRVAERRCHDKGSWLVVEGQLIELRFAPVW